MQSRKKKKDTDLQNSLLDSVGEGEGGMFQENSIETCILSRVKQITSPGWMHETSARTWCTEKTQRERVEREVGGGIGMRNTCKPMAVSFQCMTKSTRNTKKKKKKCLVMLLLHPTCFELLTLDLFCPWQLMGTQSLNVGLLLVKGISDLQEEADDTPSPPAPMMMLTFIKSSCQKHKEESHF